MSKSITLKIIAAQLAALVIFLAGCTAAEKVNPYPFDTAKISYKLEGSLEGTQDVYIKGDNSLHETHAVKKVGETETKIDLLYIELGDVMYEVDINTGSGTKSENPIYTQLQQLNATDRMDFLLKLATGVDESAAVPQSTGEKEVAGKTCKMYEMKDLGEICIWDGIPLYSNLSLAGGEIKNTMTATSVETGLNLSDNIFTVPYGVDISDLTST